MKEKKQIYLYAATITYLHILTLALACLLEKA